jgi:hypothetical protein
MTAQSLPDGGARTRSWRRPTRASFLVFAAKAAGLRLRRATGDLISRTPRLRRGDAGPFTDIAGASKTPLWSDEALSERAQQQGKVQNLRIAARALDGLVLPAGAAFSFWRQLGPPIAARGFVRGRMLQQGCMVSSVGGGLCQLSNALYDAALQAGCQIVERHAHSAVVPGSAAAHGRDATVAWNYVDLRFVATRDLSLSVRLDPADLVVRLAARPDASAPAPEPSPPADHQTAAGAARDCGSCDETDCFLHRPADLAPPPATRSRVFLVDEAWPEFQAFVQAIRRQDDRLGRPGGWRPPAPGRHAWSAEGFARVADASLAGLQRSLAIRAAGRSAPMRRRAELEAAGRIAARLARLLTPEVTSVVVAQSYLPHLWRLGLLGGREVSVLVNRLPMGVLQARLDAAAAAHRERASLVDFRVPESLLKAEADALAEAAQIVTPHAEIAALFPGRAMRLSWNTPSPTGEARRGPIRRIGFPGPTVARKGAHAVRAAAQALGLEVATLGSELEGPDFWSGVRLGAAGAAVDAVVQPALVEDQPRALLAALAAGIPVIASAACGLDPQPGLMLVPPDDAEALIAAIRLLDAAGPHSPDGGVVRGR